MTEQQILSRNEPGPPAIHEDVIDLRLVARSLWRGRWWIVGITIAGALIGIGISLLTTSYQSRGLLLTPGVSIGDYKTYSAALDNLPRWQRFVAATGKQDSATARRIGKIIAKPDPGDFHKMLSPVFAMTSTEAKQFGIKGDEDTSGLVGLNLTVQQDQESKDAPLELLADYVRSTMIRVDLQQALQSACAENRSADLTLSNQKLQNSFSIRQDQQRRATLKSILTQLPASANSAAQQVISMGKGNERFLSPVTQLVGVDVAIANKKLADARYDRKLTAAGLKADYYCKASETLDQQATGQALLTQLPDIREYTFADQDMEQDIVLQTANELQIQSDHWTQRYLAQIHFVAPAKGSEMRVRKISLLLATLLGLIGGLFLAFFTVICKEWWSVNSDVIVEPRLA